MSNNQSNNKKIAKNTFFLYGRMILVLFVSLYTTRVVLNVLGVVDYGIYNVVAGFVSMFTFLNTSMTNTIQRYYNFERGKGDVNKQKMVYNTAVQIQAVLAIVTFLLLEFIGVWFINNKMVIPVDRLEASMCIFQFSVISLVILIMQIPHTAAIVSNERMNYYAAVSIVDVVLKLLIVFLLPVIPFDKLIFYGVLSLIISVTDFFMYYIYSSRNFPEVTLCRCFDAILFKSMLSFSGWNVFSSIAYTVQGQGMNVLINSFFGPIVNAARGVAYQIQGAINGFSENIAVAFKPQLVESYASSNYVRTRNLMFSMSKLCYLMLFVLSLPVILERHYILTIWLDGVVPEHTINFVLLVLINMLIGCLNLPVSQTIQAVGVIRNYQLAKCIVIISILPIAYISLMMGGSPEYVFYAMIFTSIIAQPISLVLLHKVFDYSYKDYLRTVIMPCLKLTMLSPIFPLILYFLIPESLIRFFITTITSLIGCSLIAYFFILEKTEKELLKGFVNNFLSKINYKKS